MPPSPGCVPGDARLRVVVWNIANKKRAWEALDGLKPDICLLNEANVPSDRLGVWSPQGTVGRDGKTRRWTAAVVSALPSLRISDARPQWRHSKRKFILLGSRFQTTRRSWPIFTYERVSLARNGGIVCGNSRPDMPMVRAASVQDSSGGWWFRPAAIGLWLGLAFGSWNLLWTRLYPLAEDTEGALLAFYGPMFIAWAVVAFRDARRTGHFRDGAFAAVVAAFVTFCVLDLLVILRVNLFLNELTARADWQALMSRFPTSGFASVRGYINYHYVSEAPFKILVASTIGLVMGLIGASVGYTIRRAMNGRLNEAVR